MDPNQPAVPAQQPIQQQYVSTPPQRKPMSKVFIIILMLLLIAVVGGGAYYLGLQNSSRVNTMSKTNSVSPTIEAQSSPTAIMTQASQKYSDTIDNYSFEYPVDWAVVVDQKLDDGNYLMVAPEAIAQDAQNKINTKTMPENGFDIVLGIQPDHSTDPTEFNSNSYQTVTQKPVASAGLSGIEYTQVFTKSIGFANQGDVQTTVLFTHNGKKWRIFLNDKQYQQVFDNLIASFKFIQ